MNAVFIPMASVASSRVWQSLPVGDNDLSLRRNIRVTDHLLGACKLYVGLRATARSHLHHKGPPMLRIGGTRRLVHIQPGRGDQETRQILPHEGPATRLPRRNPQSAPMLPLWTIDVDAAAAPARVPDQAIGVDDRTIDSAGAPLAQQHLRHIARQPRRWIKQDAVQCFLDSVFLAVSAK